MKEEVLWLLDKVTDLEAVLLVLNDVVEPPTEALVELPDDWLVGNFELVEPKLRLFLADDEDIPGEFELLDVRIEVVVPNLELEDF